MFAKDKDDIDVYIQFVNYMSSIRLQNPYENMVNRVVRIVLQKDVIIFASSQIVDMKDNRLNDNQWENVDNEYGNSKNSLVRVPRLNSAEKDLGYDLLHDFNFEVDDSRSPDNIDESRYHNLRVIDKSLGKEYQNVELMKEMSNAAEVQQIIVRETSWMYDPDPVFSHEDGRYHLCISKK